MKTLRDVKIGETVTQQLMTEQCREELTMWVSEYCLDFMSINMKLSVQCFM